MESFPSDPRIWGPGVWFNIHTLALHQTRDYFIKYIRFVIEKLPCGECSNHAISYVEQNPPENYVGIKNDDGEDISMFKWTWIFHNAVNTRLGKKYIDYDTAINMYDDSVVCESSCTDNNSYLSIPNFTN